MIYVLAETRRHVDYLLQWRGEPRANEIGVTHGVLWVRLPEDLRGRVFHEGDEVWEYETFDRVDEQVRMEIIGTLGMMDLQAGDLIKHEKVRWDRIQSLPDLTDRRQVEAWLDA